MSNYFKMILVFAVIGLVFFTSCRCAAEDNPYEMKCNAVNGVNLFGPAGLSRCENKEVVCYLPSMNNQTGIFCKFK